MYYSHQILTWDRGYHKRYRTICRGGHSNGITGEGGRRITDLKIGGGIVPDTKYRVMTCLEIKLVSGSEESHRHMFLRRQTTIIIDIPNIDT